MNHRGLVKSAFSLSGHGESQTYKRLVFAAFHVEPYTDTLKSFRMVGSVPCE